MTASFGVFPSLLEGEGTLQIPGKLLLRQTQVSGNFLASA